MRSPSLCRGSRARVPVIGFYEASVRIWWSGVGYDVSLNKGRMVGSRLRHMWRLHKEDLELCRTYARSQGTRITPGGLGGPRKKKPKKSDPRQMSFEDLTTQDGRRK